MPGICIIEASPEIFGGMRLGLGRFLALGLQFRLAGG